MALADATIRIYLDLIKFESELKQRTQRAANEVGRDFDRDMRTSLSATGRNAGRDFVTNIKGAVTSAGTDVGRAFVDALGSGVAARAGRAGDTVGSAIEDGAVRGAAGAGRKAGRNFSLNFGLGSAGASKPLIAAVAVAGSALAESLRPALPIVAAIPGLLSTVTATALITATAFRGVGDAFKAVGENDLDKLTESMAKLSPLAQDFVREFAGVRPELAALRNDIQNAFFGQLVGQVATLSHAFSGPLRAGIVSVSTSAGALGRTFLEAFSEARGVANLESLFRGTSDFLNRLKPGIRDVMRGFLDFVGATSPGLASLGQAFSNLLTRFGEFLSRSAESGQALVWVEGAITGLRNLVDALVDAGRAFVVILEAAQPLSMLLGGVFSLVVKLVDAFGGLPGPIQTAALAALLFARSGMPEYIRNTTAAASPLSTALNRMGDAYRTTATRVRELQVVTTAVSNAGSLMGRGLDSATEASNRFAQSIRNNLVGATSAVGTVASRTANALQVGVVRAGLEAANAIQVTGTALRTGLVRGAVEAENALGRVAAAGRALPTALVRGALEIENAVGRVAAAGAEVRATLREGLVPTALLIGQTVERAGAAVSRFGDSVRTGLTGPAGAAGSALANLGTAVQTGFIRATLEAQAAASRLGSAIQTGVISAAIAGNNALTTFGNTLQNGVLRPLVNAQTAYRNTSTSMRDFAAIQSALNVPLGQSSNLISRLRDSFANLSVIASSAGAGLRAGFAGPISAVGTAMNGLAATAAGLGRSLASGIGSAVNGIVGALGGPWGLAIAAAGVALSLFASEQDKARQAAAAHKAEISTLADTLNRQTGAVTAATRAAAAQQFAQNDAGASARRLGVDLGTVVDATLGNTKAQTTLSTTLRNSARGAIDAAGGMKTLELQSRNLNVPVDTLIDAFLGNAAAIKRVGDAAQGSDAQLDVLLAIGREMIPDQVALALAVGSTASGLSEQAARAREVANSMTPAQAAAQRFADILGILADKTATADQKARALEQALRILAGGTIDAELAQGRFTELLSKLDDGLASGIEGLNGMGTALVTSSGRIDANTQAGAFLLDTYEQITSGLSETTAATLKAGEANNDMEGALRSVSEQTQQARDQFVQTAIALGLNETQANALANAYGLVPKNVTTLVGTNGTAAITLSEVGNVQDALRLLPPNTPVTVTSLTEEATQKLNDLGYTIKTIPNGKFEVYANTDPAQQGVDQFIRNNSGKVIAVRVETVYGSGVQAVDASGRPVGNPAVAAGAIFENYASGGLRRMQGNIAQVVPPNTWRIIGDRARDDEAYIPINRSIRSLSILDETARRMGFELMASGGLLSGTARAGSRSLTVAPGAIMVNAPFADPVLVAKATVNEIARAVAL